MSFILNWFHALEARLKRAERLRVRRLERDVAALKFALAFYARAENYPPFAMAQQASAVLKDGGYNARMAMARQEPEGWVVEEATPVQVRVRM